MILDGEARSNLVGFNDNDGGSAAFVKEIPHDSQKIPVNLDWRGLVEDTDFFFPGDKKKRRDLIGVGDRFSNSANDKNIQFGSIVEGGLEDE